MIIDYTRYPAFFILVAVCSYLMTRTAKNQAKQNPKGRLAYWLPSIPLVIGAILGLMFHPLLPVDPLSYLGLVQGFGYGLIASNFQSKIYEQLNRKVDSAFGLKSESQTDMEPAKESDLPKKE